MLSDLDLTLAYRGSESFAQGWGLTGFGGGSGLQYPLPLVPVQRTGTSDEETNQTPALRISWTNGDARTLYDVLPPTRDSPWH